MTYNLDLKDKKLLHELDCNCRRSFNQLAKKVGLSKNSISYRIDNLRKEGIIKSFNTIIDIGKLGYINFRLYFNLQNASLKKEMEIIEFLRKKESVIWLGSMEGLYNIGAIIVTKSITEMNSLWEELFSKYINYFGERSFTIITKSTYFSRAYLLGGVKTIEEIENSILPTKVDLDSIDEKLIKILSTDSRAQIIDISKSLKLSPKTIISHLRKLEKEKIIVGYRTFFDVEKLGYEYFKISFILMNVSKEKEKEFRNYIITHPNIIYQEEVLGGGDFEIDLEVLNTKELNTVIREIKSKFGDIINDYLVLHVSKEHKDLYFPSN